MRFECTTERRGAEWSMRHAGETVGTVEVVGGTRDEAAQKMRDELQYRLELCPCTGELSQDVVIELVER